MSAFSNRVHLNTDNQNKIQSKTQSNPNHNIFSNNNKSKESPKPLNIQPNVVRPTSTVSFNISLPNSKVQRIIKPASRCGLCG
jgi:hypothetical protein